MTALQKFIEQITHLIDRTKISDTMLHNLVEEHLEMEKEQIKNAHSHGFSEGLPYGMSPIGYKYMSAQDYYNETFKKD